MKKTSPGLVASAVARAGRMRRTRNVGPLALLVAVVAVSSASASGGSVQPFKVTSTLDGKKVLPLRIRWIARPHISTSKVAKVDFLIDRGRIRTDRQAPYVYGGDNHKG